MAERVFFYFIPSWAVNIFSIINSNLEYLSHDDNNNSDGRELD